MWLKDLNLVFNPVWTDKILNMTKLKAFADNKLNIAKMIISLLDCCLQTLNLDYTKIFLFGKWVSRCIIPFQNKSLGFTCLQR